jgi:hypothetical protein
MPAVNRPSCPFYPRNCFPPPSVYSSGGGSDTANLYDSASANDLYTDAAIASLYGTGFGAQVDGFGVVNAYGQSGVVNKHAAGPDPLVYQLNLFGTWVSGS